MNRVRILVLGVGVALGACTHFPTAPTRPSEDPAFEAQAVPEPAGMDPTPPSPFQLQPGDVLALKTISPAPLEAQRLSVDDAGLLHAPLMGAVPVAGAPLEEAEARLQEKLRRYDHFGLVTLTVVEPAGHRVNVLGAVAKPGLYVLSGVTRVADLVAQAGGPRSVDGDAELVGLADLEAARLLRANQPLPISVSRALTGDPRHNVPLAPGDVLFVPALQGAAVPVLGQVKSARTLSWRQGLRLGEALARAGGFNGDADEGDVRVIRGPLSKPRIYRASIADLVQGRATDVELARGDIVFVTRHWFATATDVIQRLMPLLTAGSVVTAVAAVRPVSNVSR